MKRHLAAQSRRSFLTVVHPPSPAPRISQRQELHRFCHPPSNSRPSTNPIGLAPRRKCNRRSLSSSSGGGGVGGGSSAAQAEGAAAVESQGLAAAAAEVVPEPTYAELRALAIATAVPFVGFGFMDNAILIVAGDAIDTSLGVTLGLSTMCAAAIGNIISDVAGIMMGAAIEDWCATHLKLPVPQLTAAQRQLRSVRFANQWGVGVGMTFGCIIGMCPLLFIDSNKVQVLKREAHLDTMFKDVMTEASDLIGAQRACLYLIVNREEESGWGPFSSSKKHHPKPTPDGKFLYAKYDASALRSTPASSSASAVAAVASSASTSSSPSDRYIPLGRGIVSRAALTGEAWNIYSVQSEPEFVAGHDGGAIGSDHSIGAEEFRIDNMLCVPVLDSQGRAIAVIQAVNKVSKGTTHGREGGGPGEGVESSFASESSLSSLPLLSPTHGFTNHDVQVLKALATHISVSLQRMYEDLGSGSEELRLRDTISMLKGNGGPQGGFRHSQPSASSTSAPPSSSAPPTTSSGSSSHRTLLFPED